MKISIAFVLTSFRGGGAERVMINLANNLNREKYEISFIVLDSEGEYREEILNDINFVNLNTKRVRKSYIPFIRTINSLNPHIIFSTMSHLNHMILLSKPWLKNKPKIIVRESNTPSKSQSFSNFQKKILKVLYMFASKIIVQCDEMKDDFSNYYDISKEKITRIYNPVDVKGIQKKALNQNPYNKNEINILAVGRLSEQKGFDVLIRSIEIVKEEIPTVKLTILGEGPLRLQLTELAKKLKIEKYINFKGFEKNPYTYYKYADLYVLSSRWEGFPNSLLEAISFGTSIVSTKCKSGPGEILEKGNLGMMVPVESPIELANGIIKTLKQDINIKHLLIKKSMEYDISNILLKYEMLFEEVIND